VNQMDTEDYLLIGGGALAFLYFYPKISGGKTLEQSISEKVTETVKNVAVAGGQTVANAPAAVVTGYYSGYLGTAYDSGYNTATNLVTSFKKAFGW
jgi:hypothetical protein